VHYLPKPFPIAELQRALNELLVREPRAAARSA
jgi:DNA-binding response OmpR family regulator